MVCVAVSVWLVGLRLEILSGTPQSELPNKARWDWPIRGPSCERGILEHLQSSVLEDTSESLGD